MGTAFKRNSGLYIPIVIILIWFIGSAIKMWNGYIIPSPTKTIQSALQLIEDGVLLKHAMVSLKRVFLGFFTAFILAFPAGVFLGMNAKAINFFEPILEFIRHVPPLATVPMLILWFGIGETSKIVIIVLASFFPIFLNTRNGILYCERNLLEVGDAFAFSAAEKFYRIILPATMPSIFIGMRLGLGYSWRALVGAEMIAASSGIGYMILDAEQLSRPDIIIVGILMIGILGSLIDYLFFKLSKRLLPWNEGGKQQHGWS